MNSDERGRSGRAPAVGHDASVEAHADERIGERADERTVERVDVLVVGAGPVGLAVAVELGLRGIATHLIDEVDAIGHWWTRAMNMNKRTMEHMRRWGLAETLKRINFVPPGWPANVTFVDNLGGRQLASVRAAGLGWRQQLDDAAEDALWIAQGQMQGVLLEKARALGARVEFGQRAVAVQPRADGRVEVEIEHTGSGARRRIEARYLIGCDGGRSLVRQAAGIRYEGSGALSRQVSIFFRAPELLGDLRRRGVEDSVMYLSADPAVPGTARLICGDRWEFSYRPPPGFDEAGFDAEKLVRRLVGPQIAFEFERSYPFSYFELTAHRFRAGAVLIAGDASHMIPPLGGHNLNLGFGDAVNLAWKLAHVLRGWADEALLDSYSPERLPMVQRTAAEAHQNYERLRSTFERLAEVMAIAGDAPADWQRREALSRSIARDLEPQWQSDGTVLDQRYEHSPIVAAEPAPPMPYHPARYQRSGRPGHRAPMWRDADGTPLYDRFGPEYTVLDLSDDGADGTRLARELQARHVPAVAVHQPVPALRELYGARLTLIRPDQHVAWRGDAPPDEVAALVARLTGRLLPGAASSERESACTAARTTSVAEAQR